MSLTPLLIYSPGISGLISKVMGLVSVSLTSFPRGSVVKNPSANAGDTGLIPGSGRFPGEGYGKPIQHSCLGNSMDRGAWQGYSPWGCKRVGRGLATKHSYMYTTSSLSPQLSMDT